jgi:Rhodopirellula transposase DDE domain
MNWRGRPLTSHEVIVNTIAAATTRTGLTVRAGLDPGSYPEGVKVSDEQMAALPLDRHNWHGDWNYALRPEPPALPPPPQPPAREPQRPDWAHPALTGLGTSDWNQMIGALTVPYQAQRDAGAGRPPANQQAGTRPPSPSPNRPWSPCCASASARPSTSSPNSSVSSPALSPRQNARPGRCSSSMAFRSSQPGNRSRPWPG